VEGAAQTVAVLAAGLAGLWFILRGAWRVVRAAQSVYELLHTELTHNHGGSMKDEVAAIAVAVGKLQADLTDLAEAKDTDHALIRLQLETLGHELTRPLSGTPGSPLTGHRPRERGKTGWTRHLTGTYDARKGDARRARS
jgi:hypothetical protein